MGVESELGGISVASGAAAGGFALTATHFSRRRKVSKRLCPGVRPTRWGSGFLRYGIDPGAAAPVCFAAPPSAVYDCVVRSLRSHPRIDPVTKPAEGAKGQEPKQSKAKAKARSKDRSLRQLLQLDRVNSIGIGCLADRHREQARSYNWIGYTLKKQVGRLREQARSHRKARQRSCPRRSRPTQQ